MVMVQATESFHHVRDLDCALGFWICALRSSGHGGHLGNESANGDAGSFSSSTNKQTVFYKSYADYSNNVLTSGFVSSL